MIAYDKGTLDTSARETAWLGPSLERLEALADTFELLACAFSFPSLALAEALSTGSFKADLNACLRALDILAPAGIGCHENQQELYASMKREYSRLYLSPGRLAVIYPYESAFLFIERGGEGFPTLIANPTTAAVERAMRAVDLLPETARKEPADSIYAECDFMKQLYTGVYVNLLAAAEDPQSTERAECVERAKQWLTLANEFRAQHINAWLPQFMEQTARHARIPVYRQLAEASQLVLTALCDK
jgi:TorA maturation chaperone TorD